VQRKLFNMGLKPSWTQVVTAGWLISFQLSSLIGRADGRKSSNRERSRQKRPRYRVCSYGSLEPSMIGSVGSFGPQFFRARAPCRVAVYILPFRWRWVEGPHQILRRGPIRYGGVSHGGEIPDGPRGIRQTAMERSPLLMNHETRQQPVEAFNPALHGKQRAHFVSKWIINKRQP